MTDAMAAQSSRRIPRTLRSVATAALCIVLFASVLLLLAVGLGPRTGHYRVLTVLTGSMRPVAPPGSLIVVTPEPLSKVRVGQVLTYQIPVGDRRVVSHRVVAVTDAGTDHPTIETKGDANDARDPWRATLSGGVAWRMRASVPHVGSVIRLLRSPVLRQLAVGVVPVALALLWLVQIWAAPTERETNAREPDAVAV